MLCEELQALTSGDCTYDEFQAIEAIYNNCANMTKRDAARVWKMTYGKEHKRRNAIRRHMEEQVLSEVHLDFTDRSAVVRSAILEAAGPLRGFAYYTDSSGVEWRRREWRRTPNGCYWIYDLGIMVDGEFHYLGYRYF